MKVGKVFRKEQNGAYSDQKQLIASIQFKLDHFKQVSERSSVQILDFLGDIGGFQGAIEMIFAIGGAYFSSKFIQLRIA